MPTHFRYFPVAEASYGLSAPEILLADDKDLNEYVGLKKLASYRNQRDKWDPKHGERLREFKTKISERLGGPGADDAATGVDDEHKAKKRKGKKERMREKAARALDEAEVVQEVATKTTDSPKTGYKHAKEQREDIAEDIMGITATTSSEPAKKKRRRQKKSENPVKEAIE